MGDRVIDLSEQGAYLSLRNGLLCVKAESGTAEVPVDELAVVIAANPQVTFTHGALSALAQAGVMVVCCDEKRLPAAMLLAVQGNHVQTERFARQVAVSEPTRKRLWQQVVQEKIRAQARVLMERNGQDAGLGPLANTVRSGDPDNLEAQAARRYWSALFPVGFRRNPMDEDQNILLNYGYAVVRALVARSIVGAGLHPSFGLHHHNRGNPFCLADDLMEPLRPMVDRVVARWVDEHGPQAPLDRAARTALVGVCLGPAAIEGETRALPDAVFRMASSLEAVFAGRGKRLSIPDV